MITVAARQHILSSVERGYFPQQGRGFQTVAVSKELVGTRDLHTLERASFYSLNRDHRQRGQTPVKETFFQLPSGCYAIGRTIDFGVDSMGREGNFLAHHLVIESEDLIALEGNPFTLLDAIEINPQSIDLTPRELPALELRVTPFALDYHPLEEVSKEFLSNLAMCLLDATEKTVLLVAEEAKAKSILRALFGVLAIEERLHLRFSTHFFESHDLRQFFTFAAAHSMEEIPSQMKDYLLFDLANETFIDCDPDSDYSAWLAESLGTSFWKEIRSLNRLIDRLRGQIDDEKGYDPPTSQHACLALWERAGTKTALAVRGNPKLTADYLKWLPAPRLLADALLESTSPSELCGGERSSDEAVECLTLLQASATGRVWREWVRRWREDAALANLKRESRPWWKLW